MTVVRAISVSSSDQIITRGPTALTLLRYVAAAMGLRRPFSSSGDQLLELVGVSRKETTCL